MLDDLNDPLAAAARGMPASSPPVAAPAPPAVSLVDDAKAASSTVAELLDTLGLAQYADAFQREAMELGVLLELASDEGGKTALDEALKEVGVASVGHRLKIFSALQKRL